MSVDGWDFSDEYFTPSSPQALLHRELPATSKARWNTSQAKPRHQHSFPAQGIKKAAVHSRDKGRNSAELVDGRAKSKRQPFELIIMPLASARMHNRNGG